MPRLLVPSEDKEKPPIFNHKTFDISEYRKKYKHLTPKKEQVLAKLSRDSFHFLFPYVQPVFVTDVLKTKDKDITSRQYHALIEKIRIAEEFGVHPDEVIIYDLWGAV